MISTIAVGETVYAVTLARDPVARTWTARWEQFGKPRELVARGSVSDVMSAARLQAQKIEDAEGDEPTPETERVP